MAKSKIGEDGLKLTPIHARRDDDKRRSDDRVWFYEEPTGISVQIKLPDAKHVSVWIPYRPLSEYVHAAKVFND